MEDVAYRDIPPRGGLLDTFFYGGLCPEVQILTLSLFFDKKWNPLGIPSPFHIPTEGFLHLFLLRFSLGTNNPLKMLK